MALEIDQALIAVHDLDKAIADYMTLGFTVVLGGLHNTLASRSARILFSNSTGLELLENPQVDARAFDEGLIGYVLRTSDLEAEIARLRDAGFSLSEVTTHTQERDGRTITWKQARVTNPALLFLIQDITPRDWRLPLDASLTTHANRSIRMTGFEIITRDLDLTSLSYARLLNVFEPELNSIPMNVGFFSIDRHTSYKRKYLDESPLYPPGYLTDIADGRITDVNMADEPDDLEILIRLHGQTLEEARASGRRELMLESILQNQSEYPTAVKLVRENCDSKLFTLERTHGVCFFHKPGVPPERGLDVLIGLDSVDWAAFHHAYGPATDVPELLRALTSDDEAVVQYKADELSNNLTHQQDIYPASIEAIPFFMQLIEAPQVDHTAPLDMLSFIGPAGLDDTELQAVTRQRLDVILPAIIRNLTHPERDVRLYLVEMLPLYPDQYEHMELLLKERIQTDDSLKVRASALQSLINLWIIVNQAASHKGLLDSQQDYVRGIMQDANAAVSLRFRAALAVIQYDLPVWLDSATSVLQGIIKHHSASLTAQQASFDRSIYGVAEAFKDHPDRFLNLLVNLTHHPDHEVRQSVGWSLSELVDSGMDPARVLPTIGLLLDDPNPNVRQSVLGFFYHVAAPPPDFLNRVKSMAKHDRSIMIREMAKNILAQLENGPNSIQ